MMAFLHLRRMWNHCRRCHKFFEHTKTFSTAKSSFMKDDFLTLCTRMYTSRQFSVACLDRNLFCQLQIHSDRSFGCFLLNFSTCNVQYKSKAVNDIVSSALNDIDLAELKEQVLLERKETHGQVHLISKVKEEVSKRCDEMLANLGPEDEKKLKVIKLEHSFFLSEGYEIPSPEQMTSQNWLEALKLSSKTQRLKYYLFLMKRLFIKEAARLKRAAPKEEREKVIPYEHGRIFMRIYETTMKRWLNYRLAASMKFGIPLVIDMDYDTIMRPREMRNTASQLHDIYGLNRSDTELPFHLHFTKCPEDNSLYRLLQLQLQEDPEFLATVTEKSYLDLFNKESLVYLSPNGRQVMKEFDPNTVYIIGAYNDKSASQPISYARANEQRIKCLRLPLDDYMNWGLGSKSLTLDQIIKILLAVKNKKSWPEAFKAIPKRKLQNSAGSNRSRKQPVGV